MKELIIATTNRHKRSEIAELLKGANLKVASLADHPGHPLVVEDGSTFEENAVKKALEISSWAEGKMVLADDSGLEVAILDGLPGIYSARFSGRNATDESNMSELLEMLEGVPEAERGAAFVCSVAIAENGDLLEVFMESCSGTIATAPRGSSGFGYDPVFIPVGHSRTFAEMTPLEKNALSHRGKALAKAGDYLAGFV